MSRKFSTPPQTSYIYSKRMSEITYTLLSDGTSDKALLPIIDWTIRKHHPDIILQSQWADFSLLSMPPKELSERIKQAIELYPCDWLVIHRDGEKQPIIDRQQEIDKAWQLIARSYTVRTVIGIIPVRMTEAWLLLDEKAIKLAAGNPSGRQKLSIPSIKQLESLPDPKQTLQQLLREASELSGRRLRKFNVSKAVQLVAENISDFSALNELNAFLSFEKLVITAIQTL